MSDSGGEPLELLPVVDGNLTVRGKNDSNMATGLAFSPTAIIIPTVVFGIIVVILLIYYVWICVENYLEAREEEKAAAAEAAKKAPEESQVKPEQVSVPIPVDEPVPAADGVDELIEDTTATDGDIEEGENGS